MTSVACKKPRWCLLTAAELHAALLPGDLAQTLLRVTDAAVELLPDVDGATITVEHADGTITAYAHMSKILARSGAEVAAGETIGLVGTTGSSTGNHLHFEVRTSSGAINPRPWLAERGVDV